MRYLFLLIYIAASLGARAQAPQALTLQEVYRAARQHYPLSRQKELIAQSQQYSLENAAKGYLPQLRLQGQASHQSEVTQIPIRIPGMEVPTLSKTQYRIYGDASQVVFDGGTIKQQLHAIQAQAQAEEQQLEVELYQLKTRVNHLFFGILALDEQARQNDILQNDMQAGIRKMQGALAHGTALKSSLQLLEAELLKARQHRLELQATRKAYADMLGLMINQPLAETTVLLRPVAPTSSADITRPELQLFTFQQAKLDIQDKLLAARQRPRFHLFFQGGLGRPGLNLLSNALSPYAIGGLRLDWNLSGYYTRRHESALLQISRKSLELQKETFLFNTQLTRRQQQADVARLQELIASDEAIIALRSSIKQAAAAQLANGVIGTHDYVREVHAEDQARQMKILHQIQLLLAQYQLQTTTGP